MKNYWNYESKLTELGGGEGSGSEISTASYFKKIYWPRTP